MTTPDDLTATFMLENGRFFGFGYIPKAAGNGALLA